MLQTHGSPEYDDNEAQSRQRLNQVGSKSGEEQSLVLGQQLEECDRTE